MTIPHEFQVWYQDAPVICIGVDFDFDCYNTASEFDNSFICIDESYEPDRRRIDIF